MPVRPRYRDNHDKPFLARGGVTVGHSPCYLSLSAWFLARTPQLFGRGFSLEARLDFARPPLALALCPPQLGMDAEQPIQLRLGDPVPRRIDFLSPLAKPSRRGSTRPRPRYRPNFDGACSVFSPSDPRRRGGQPRLAPVGLDPGCVRGRCLASHPLPGGGEELAEAFRVCRFFPAGGSAVAGAVRESRRPDSHASGGVCGRGNRRLVWYRCLSARQR